VQAHIGIHDFELHTAQRIVLDVDLYVSMKGTSPKDDQH
jgi:dihydroneopterin aldolase